MRRKKMKKVDKELKKMHQIADGIGAIKGARESVEALAVKYTNWIDEAAELGEDEYSDQLIAEQVDVEGFARDLAYLESKVTNNAVIAKTFNEFNNLAAAMSACEKLLKQGPDLKALGKRMVKFKASLNNAHTSLKDLRAELSTSKDPVYTKLFGTKSDNDSGRDALIDQKKRERQERLIHKELEKQRIKESKEKNESFTHSGSNDLRTGANVDEITRMIDEKNEE